MAGGGKGGGGSSKIDVDNHGTTNVISDGTTKIVGLDNMHSDSKTALTLSVPEPVKTETTGHSDLTIRVPDPIHTIGETTLDIKPLVADLCFTVTNRTPPTCIRQPYHHRFAVEVYGQEVMALVFTGEAQTIIDELKHGPQVAWGGTETRPSAAEDKTPQIAGDANGLRIRVGE